MKPMRILAALSFVVLIASSVNAQGLGYVEGGLAGVHGFFGQWSDSTHVGGGGEAVIADHVGVGAEVGFFNRLIVLSPNATVHLGGVANAKFSPFVTAGYSWMGIGDGEGMFDAYNIGAGFNYWAGDRVAFRMEFRDHFRPDDRGTVQYWSVRAGVSFR